MNHRKIPDVLALIVIALFINPQPSKGLGSKSLGRGIESISQSSCVLTVLPNNGAASGNERAPNTNFRFGRAVYLITAAELAAHGYQNGSVPTSIGWNYAVGNSAGASAPLIIYLQNTADTTNTKSTTWATAISGMTTVHNATTMLPSAIGPFDITFTGGSSFTYTGDGLYVAFDWGQYTGTVSTTAQVFCDSSLAGGLLGGQSQTVAPTTVAPTAFRPETRLTGTVSPNDAAVSALYSYGELPLGLVPAQAIKSVISNKGSAALNNLPVMLNITGADTFSDTQNIASLSSCTGQSTVMFAPYTPAALGTDTVTVSVPADDVAANNMLTKPTAITQLSYSYKYPGSMPDGGVGFDPPATGAFVGKFTTTAANAVTAVQLEFPTVVATTYRVAIYGDSGTGTPSTTPLYVDAADRMVGASGPVTITLPSPVAVGPGNFFVGIQQTNTTNANFSYDNEVPIRSGSFFFASPNPPTAWIDFSPGNDFKINVGILLQTPGAPTATGAVSRKTHGAAGTFDVNLPLTGTPGIEPRSGGATNDYTMSVTFTGNVTVSGSPQAQVTSGSALIGSGGMSNGGNVIVSGNIVTIPLTSVANAQTINVTLNGVNGALSDTPADNVVIPMSKLLGDTSGNGSVNASDASQTKSRIGQVLDATNFRSDVSVNGTINASDTSLVKSSIGTALP